MSWIHSWNVQPSIYSDVKPTEFCSWKNPTGISNHLRSLPKSCTVAIHSPWPRAGVKVKAEAPRWPRKEGRRLLFPSTCLNPSHLMGPGQTGEGQWWCYQWVSFLIRTTKFSASKPRVSPLNSGNNFCIYLHIPLTTWRGKFFLPSNNQSHVSI